jgi:hypothetical protein
MSTLSIAAKEKIIMDMQRDDVRVIERRGGNLAELRKRFASLHTILDKMPRSKADTNADLKVTRESRGLM